MSILTKEEELQSFGLGIEDDLKNNKCPTLTEFSVKELVMQFWGFELVLMPDGTYFFTDTSGG